MKYKHRRLLGLKASHHLADNKQRWITDLIPDESIHAVYSIMRALYSSPQLIRFHKQTGSISGVGKLSPAQQTES